MASSSSSPPPAPSDDDDVNDLASDLQRSTMIQPQPKQNEETVSSTSVSTEPKPNPKSLPTTLTRHSTSTALLLPATSSSSSSSSSTTTTTTTTMTMTEGWVQLFQDRIVVGVTQLPSKHVGQWCLCQASQSPIHPQQIDYNISVLLGSGNSGSNNNSSSSSVAPIELYARRITECIIQRRLIPAGSNQMNILLGMSLVQTKKTTKQTTTAPKEDNNDTTTNNNQLELDRQRFHAVVEFCVELIKDALEKFL